MTRPSNLPFNAYHSALCRALGKKGLQYTEEYPIGPYSVDIYLPELHLLVEVDGPFHFAAADKKRSDRILELRPDLRMVRVKVGTPMAKALGRILECASPQE